MKDARTVRDGQRFWAIENGVPFDSLGYVDDVEMNLREPLSAAALQAFGKGAGSELAKHMRALHSSSALVANFFDHWTSRDKASLLSAFSINGKEADLLEFEVRFPTELGGTPPHQARPSQWRVNSPNTWGGPLGESPALHPRTSPEFQGDSGRSRDYLLCQWECSPSTAAGWARTEPWSAAI